MSRWGFRGFRFSSVPEIVLHLSGLIASDCTLSPIEFVPRSVVFPPPCRNAVATEILSAAERRCTYVQAGRCISGGLAR
eukprot:2782439-Rhodomonas_salina.1